MADQRFLKLGDGTYINVNELDYIRSTRGGLAFKIHGHSEQVVEDEDVIKNIISLCHAGRLQLGKGDLPNINTEEYFPDSKFRTVVDSAVAYNKYSKETDEKSSLSPPLSYYNKPFTIEDTQQIGGTLDCSRREIKTLTGIELLPNIRKLKCEGNQISHLNLGQNRNLEVIWCYSNKLSSLDVSTCSRLCELVCHDNSLKKIDLRGCSMLNRLICYENNVESILLNTDCFPLEEIRTESTLRIKSV